MDNVTDEGYNDINKVTVQGKSYGTYGIKPSL